MPHLSFDNLNAKKSRLSIQSAFADFYESNENNILNPADAKGCSYLPGSNSNPNLKNVAGVATIPVKSHAGLLPIHSSPILAFSSCGYSSDTEKDVKSSDSGLSKEARRVDSVEFHEGDHSEERSDCSNLFSSSSNICPDALANDKNNLTSEFKSIESSKAVCVLADITSSDFGQEMNPEKLKKKRRNRSRRKISNWYQESLVKSYRAKVCNFKKIFNSTPVDTNRLLVDYSCALAKNKNGLLFVGRMYVTEKWVCFYSKIIYEQKLYFAIDEIQSISKAKTARLIPNAIKLTLKSNERYFFTSFASRERTFAILKRICENNVVGNRLLPSESEGVNMEELLCQVQDVYGDESLAVLDFEVDELPARRWPSSGVLKRGLANTPMLSAECLTRLPNELLTHRHQPCTPGPFRSFSCDELSEGDTTTTSAATTTSLTTDDEATDKSQEGIVISFNEQDRSFGRRPSHKTARAPLPPPSLKTTAKNLQEIEEDEDDDVEVPQTCGAGHKHPGRTYADTSINLSVDALFACLFTDSQFFGDFCAHRGIFDVEQSQWPLTPWSTPEIGEDSIHRKISYVLTLKQRLAPRTCLATENQTILLRETRIGRRYVVDAKVTNEAAPLCNSFHVTSRYCLLRRSATVSHLIITSEVVYDRPVFFGAKSIIESTCKSNLTDNFNDLVGRLSTAVARLSEEERATGGPLAKPYRHRPARGDAFGPMGSLKEGLENAAEVKWAEDGRTQQAQPLASSQSAPSTLPQLHRGLSIPQVLLYPNQQRDKQWLFIIVLSLGLCLFLSVIYNHFQGLEKFDPIRYDVYGPSSSVCDELSSIRGLFESVSAVVAQMEKTLKLLERRLDQMDAGTCGSTPKETIFGK